MSAFPQAPRSTGAVGGPADDVTRSSKVESRWVTELVGAGARVTAVLASAVVDDDLRLGEADQGILRVWAVMVGPVP